jgi:two-component system, NarL family, nitrate/nitrite response regulator NarL
VDGNPLSQNVAMTNQTQQHPIRLALLAEAGLFRAGVCRFLSSEPGLEVIGECGTPGEALEVIARSAVDVVVLDWDVATKHPGEFMLDARRSGYRGRFLIVTGMLDARKSALVLKLGASGIFLKSDAPERLVEAIRLVADGEAWVDQKVIEQIVDQLIGQRARGEGQELDLALDDRERHVLVGILEGLPNRKIADHAGLSENSVKNIVQRLFRRAGVKSRSQLVRVALGGPADAVHI